MMLENIFVAFYKLHQNLFTKRKKDKNPKDSYLCKIQLEQPQISLSVRLCVKEKHWK